MTCSYFVWHPETNGVPDNILLILSKYTHLVSLHFKGLVHVLLRQDLLLLMQKLTTGQYAKNERFWST